MINGLARLLVILLEAGEIDVTSLRERMGVALNTLYGYLKEAEHLGLIKSKYERKPPNRRFISLTEKGRKVAEKLREIYEILEA